MPKSGANTKTRLGYKTDQDQDQDSGIPVSSSPYMSDYASLHRPISGGGPAKSPPPKKGDRVSKKPVSLRGQETGRLTPIHH